MMGIGKVLTALAGAVLAEAMAPDQPNSFLGVGYDPTKAQASTANPAVCTSIYIVLVGGFAISVVAEYVLKNQQLQRFGLFWNLVGAIAATVYASYHGLVKAWWAGGHNLTNHCTGIAAAALVMYVFFGCFCVFGSAFAVKCGLDVVSKMKEATLKRCDTLPDSEKDYLNSKEFLAKCNDMFLEADKDGNGVLNIKELKQFVLKDLPEEQQARLHDEELFKEAFDFLDENQNGSIDQEEFVEVMKYCRAHAHSDA